MDVTVGSWHGECKVTKLALDDFDLILGNEFLCKASVAVMPHLLGFSLAVRNLHVLLRQ